MDRHDERVRARAEQMWRDAGSPSSAGPEHYEEQASDLVALEENPDFGLRPVEPAGPYGEPVEEADMLENLGEFPTLTDTGEQKIPGEPEPEDADVPFDMPEPDADLEERLPEPEPDLVRRPANPR